MATFYFNCPFCKKEIKADTEWIGQSAECPYCSNMLVINKPQNTSKKTQLLPKLSVADTGKKDEQLKIINCPDCNKEMSARAEVAHIAVRQTKQLHDLNNGAYMFCLDYF